jgi:hypothetical protein
MKRRLLKNSTLVPLFILPCWVGTVSAAEDPPMNQVQFIGTHNSYHIAPSAKVHKLIETFAKGEGDAIAHTHRPLREQLEKLGIRQFELDLFADPKGGKYANPLGAKLAGETDPHPHPAWKLPGLKILHSPDFDFRTTVPSLKIALEELVAWSKDHPQHEPVLVLLELKEQSFSPRIKPLPFDESELLNLEAEIKAVLPDDKILTPDAVRGNSPTLREAVTQRGWPKLSEAAGKFMFALDNGGSIRDRYLALSPDKDLKERLLFVDVPKDHPAAAWMKRNHPIRSYQEIRSLVAAGFMVRTRADESLREVRAADDSRFQKAASSGAQWISTDAPEELPGMPGYKVQWKDGKVWRKNVVIEE